jgi:SHS2 domain-containing protein
MEIVMHEVFEHTADLGLRIRQSSLEALLSEAGTALFELMVENLTEVQPRNQQEITLHQPDRALMLFDWLNELIYLFDAKHMVLCQFSVTVRGDTLHAVVSGEPRDEQRHQLDHEVKAVTYHQLKLVQEGPSDWRAEVILDI